MAKHPDPKEPAMVPAPIPPLRDIIVEGNREIAAQARAAVENVVSKGDFASSAQLRKWGPRGAKYFFDVLQGKIAEKSRPAKKQSARSSAPSVPVAADHHAPIHDGAASGKATKRHHRGTAVTTERDWIAQQRHRWSVRTRAILHGLLVATVLFAGAAVFIRLWPGLMPAVLQQIQNWRQI